MNSRPETAEQPIAPARPRSPHKFVEAFRLMLFTSSDGAEIETIWNSRDGSAPLVVVSKDGTRELRHVLWGADPYAPHHVPNVGERLIVSIAAEQVDRVAQETARRLWNDKSSGYQGQFASEQHAYMAVRAEMEKPGAPTLVTATPEIQQALLQKRSEMAQLFQRRRLDQVQGLTGEETAGSSPAARAAR